MKQRDLLIGAGLILLGVLFLLGPAIGLARFGWPFFVIVPGAALLFVALATPVSGGALAVPGAILTTIGLMLLVFSATNHWEGWAYAWALILAASGVGTYLHGRVADDPRLKRDGIRATVISLLVFLALTLFFELLVYGEKRNVLSWLIPGLMIVVGAFMVYRNRRGAKAPPARGATPGVSSAPQPPSTAPGSRAQGDGGQAERG